jgi:CBS domain containing-hemolysin-like protein
MSDSSSSSRRPRGGGAEPEAAQSLGGSILSWLRRLAGAEAETDLRESLEEIVREQGANGLTAEQREMLLNIADFGELNADDLMVPRADIEAVKIGASLDEVVDAFRQARHSRLPVYRETLDDVAGFIHIKDVLDFWRADRTFSVEAILREVLVAPPSLPALTLLARMRSRRIHMAVVIDEYGGVDGLVTVEDVVEEIVGELEDEHDAETPLIIEHPDGSIDADARAEIEEFEELYGVDLAPDETDEEVDTLGGLICSMTGRVPRRGEKVRHPTGLEFEIVDADFRRVKRLRVRRLPEPEASRVE